MTLKETKEHNVTDVEFDMMHRYMDCVSDMDMGVDGSYAIEWDGPYGRHWEYYRTVEERDARLARHSEECIAFLPEVMWMVDEERVAKHRVAIAKGEKKRFLKVAKTLGGQHPELGELLVKMRNEYKKVA